MLETDLYPPIKRFLEGQGYEVKSEIGGCDILAVRNGEPPVVVEMKTSLSLELVLQGVDRLSFADTVYIAAAAAPGGRRAASRQRRCNDMLGLCRRLGLGLLTVDAARRDDAAVMVHLDPAPYRPRKNKRREALLLKEFTHRVGDPNRGGSSRQPIVTAYRQDALRCVRYLGERGTAQLSALRRETRIERATGILQRDVYGWFLRHGRGHYGLSPKGRAAMDQFAAVLSTL